MFNQDQFNKLVEFQNTRTPCVSIYIPTYKVGNVQEDRLRFKNALSEATQQLMSNTNTPAGTMEKKEALTYLAPAYALLDNEDFWQHLSEGLVVFLTEDHFSYYITNIDFSSLVYVHNHFYLRPVIPLLQKEDRFFVLALSQNEVRFFEGNETSITPVIIEDLLPNGMEEMIGAEDVSQNLQARSGGADSTIYHGHGAGKDDKVESLKKYFRDVDNGLMEMLHDERAPLIIYSVDYQIPIYQSISDYLNVYPVGISGNPENDDPVMIHEKAWSVIGDHFKEKNKTTKEGFNQQLVNGKASFSIHEIVPAAVQGKVDQLFTDSETVIEWGIYDEKNHSTQLHVERKPDSTCLLNKAAIETYTNGGKVINNKRANLPRVIASTNAIFRY
ncbi:MAG: hypothetical protein AAF573_00370 [Bacteroidota bacterium]